MQSYVTKMEEQPLKTKASHPRPVYVVLGMHRSGTSLCSSVMNMLGIDMAEEEGSGDGNEAGHWERWPLVALQDEILNAFDRHYFGNRHDFPMPVGWWARPHLRPVVRRIKDYIGSVADENASFGFKDPRTAKLLPIWKNIFADLNLHPKYIICLRNPSHIAASLERRDHLPRDVGEMRSLDYLVNAFRFTEGCERHYIRYEQWFDDPLATIKALADFVGHHHHQDERDVVAAIEGLIRPELNHGPGAERHARQPLVRHFYNLVERVARDADADQSADQQLRKFIESYYAFHQLLTPFETLQKGERETYAQTQALLTERDAALAAGEQHVTEANQSVTEADRRVAVAEQRVSEVEQALAAADGRAAAAEQRATEANLAVKAAEDRAATADQRVIEVEQAQAAANERTTAAEQIAADAEQAAGAAERRVAAAMQRVTELEDLMAANATEKVFTSKERDSVNERCEVLQQQLDTSVQRIAFLEDLIRHI